MDRAGRKSEERQGRRWFRLGIHMLLLMAVQTQDGNNRKVDSLEDPLNVNTAKINLP